MCLAFCVVGRVWVTKVRGGMWDKFSQGWMWVKHLHL